MTAAGHFSRGAAVGGVTSWGYGYFSMNLASPFWPQRSGLFRGFWDIVDRTGGQYEGFNYLGFGALVLIITALAMEGRDIVSRVRAHRWLTIVLVGLTLFAMTTHIYAGQARVMSIGLGPIARILGTFRSSGRMFWPVAYVAILLSLAVVLRGLPPRWRTLFVALCCGLQIVDSEPLRVRMLALSSHDAPGLLDREEWIARIDKASFLYIFPTVGCDGPWALPNLELQLAAMLGNRPVNSVYNARLYTNCEQEAANSRSGPWREDALYVFLGAGAADDALPAPLSCAKFAYGAWCMGPKQNSK
jgi:hypothetical protein